MNIWRKNPWSDPNSESYLFLTEKRIVILLLQDLVHWQRDYHMLSVKETWRRWEGPAAMAVYDIGFPCRHSRSRLHGSTWAGHWTIQALPENPTHGKDGVLCFFMQRTWWSDLPPQRRAHIFNGPGNDPGLVRCMQGCNPLWTSKSPISHTRLRLVEELGLAL